MSEATIYSSLCFISFKKCYCMWVSILLACMCITCVPGTHGQKRVSDPLELESQKIVCWELNLGPLKEQPVLLTTEPSFF
jgi:hypothetical protein